MAVLKMHCHKSMYSSLVRSIAFCFLEVNTEEEEELRCPGEGDELDKQSSTLMQLGEARQP